MVGREIRAKWTADLHCPHRTTARGTAAELLDQLANGDAEGRLEDSAVRHIASDLHDLRTTTTTMAKCCIRGCTVGEDRGDGSKAEHVVDDCRLAPQSFDGGQRRLGAHDATLALDALHQRGLFATDVGASADSNVQPELEVRAQHA